MGVISQLKDSHGNSSNHLPYISIEGTSARTRPFSFEDVILRRKNKNVAAELIEEADQSKELPKKGKMIPVPEHFNSSDVPEPKRVSEDLVRGNSRRHDLKKEEVLSEKKEGSSKYNHRIKDDVEIVAEVRRTTDKRSRDRHLKADKQDHHRKTNDQFEEYEKEIQKKHHKDVLVKDVDMERGRKSERDIRKSHHTGNNVKIKSEIDRSGLKKPDVHKLQYVEHYEKRGRRYEEPKSKKRRSRSREYDHLRERSASISPRARIWSSQRSPLVSPRARKWYNQRSPSISPRALKRSHQRSASISPRVQKRSRHGHIGHDHVGSSSHLFRERSGNESSETDRCRTSRNGGSTRCHGIGLGGYSPRKRKTGTVTKTPSPTPRSPERKIATWDQPPAGVVANIQSSTTKTNELPSSIPTIATPAKSQSAYISNTPTIPLEISLDAIQLTQATRPKRRLYIENLPSSASDKAVTDWLNDFLRSSGVSRVHGNSPCISCIINKEKCQAVVEFLTPEDATEALSLNGKSFSGSSLKIRRPKDFIDLANVNAEKAPDVTEVSHAVFDVVKDSPQKIFIGGISNSLTSGMLMEIVRSFGTLKAYQFEVNEFGEPYAFLEYLDSGATSDACTGLNGMKLGGQVLTVVKAFPDWSLDGELTDSFPSVDIPIHAKPLLMNPTKVLKLMNAFNLEEFMLLADPELEEILEDVRTECARFGTVKSINAVRQVTDNSACASEQNTNAVIRETSTVDLSETEYSGDDVALNVPPDVEDTSRSPITDGHSLEKEASDPSQVGITSNPSQVDVANEEPQLDAVEAETPPENLHLPAMAEAAEHSPSETGLVSEELKPGSVEIEMVELQTDLNPTDVEKSHGVEEGKKVQSSNMNIFEPGCILVEFMREEAACLAAHCLNGRPYDGRIVEVSYVSHDAYLEQFPR